MCGISLILKFAQSKAAAAASEQKFEFVQYTQQDEQYVLKTCEKSEDVAIVQTANSISFNSTSLVPHQQEQQQAAKSEDSAINKDAELISRLEAVISKRGPDATNHVTVPILNNNIFATFIGSLLALRGTSPTIQPLVLNETHYLLWNGEIFGGDLYEKVLLLFDNCNKC